MFERINELLQEHDLELIWILSPPRTCSTVLEKSLIVSDDVLGQINEPWAQYDREAYPETDRVSYTIVFLEQRLRVLLKKNKKSGAKKVIVKDICYFIPLGKIFEQYAALFKKTLMLIRNPLLSTKSLLTVMVSTAKFYTDKEQLDGWAKLSGFSSWADLEENTLADKDFSLATAFFLGYSKQIETIFKEEAFTESISFLSTSYGENKQAIYDTWLSGWFSLASHVGALEAASTGFFVIEATLLRLFPEDFFRKMCDYLGISYSTNLIGWSGAEVEFAKGYEKVNGVTPFFDRALSSEKIEAPLEKISSVNKLPDFYKNYFLSKKLSPYKIYTQLFMKVVDCFSSEFDLDVVKKKVWNFSSIDPVFVFIFFLSLEDADVIEKLQLDLESFDLYGLCDTVKYFVRK